MCATWVYVPPNLYTLLPALILICSSVLASNSASRTDATLRLRKIFRFKWSYSINKANPYIMNLHFKCIHEFQKKKKVMKTWMRENTCVTCTWYMDSSGKKKNEESRKEMPGHRQGNNLRFSEAIIIVMLCYEYH